MIGGRKQDSVTEIMQTKANCMFEAVRTTDSPATAFSN